MGIYTKFHYYAFFIYSLEVGMLLIVLPWLDMWDKNYLFFKINYLGELMRNLYIRGAISGLGVSSILIAFSSNDNMKANPEQDRQHAL
ncbi:MAG: hypothetical protein A2Y62_02485 [Candidatus Fischerbacteria bacterium RBG_13_37_8]|uniref:Uncharacterized protein n=1 Tax=Candidatus Fischerbacteria bacterium RBG_13_37_8 TaxID=1817863 RepID=A0A1F5VHX7_9BACT|nr:MAG: hypothetical protein A2Y62_02485 [Candidatus Fischerbacteria bacterium RBG_13_37_8]